MNKVLPYAIMKKNHLGFLDQVSSKITAFIGTPLSIVIHTLLFIGIFFLSFFGFSVDQILLILTTAVSLEAIYLSIFIQMTVNKNTQALSEVEKDIDEIQEDVQDLGEEKENALLRQKIDRDQVRLTRLERNKKFK